MIISDLDHMSAVSDAELLSGAWGCGSWKKKDDYEKDCCKPKEPEYKKFFVKVAKIDKPCDTPKPCEGKKSYY